MGVLPGKGSFFFFYFLKNLPPGATSLKHGVFRNRHSPSSTHFARRGDEDSAYVPWLVGTTCWGHDHFLQAFQSARPFPKSYRGQFQVVSHAPFLPEPPVLARDGVYYVHCSSKELKQSFLGWKNPQAFSRLRHAELGNARHCCDLN